MDKPNLLSRIMGGLVQHPVKLLVNVFLVYAAIWTILEPLTTILSPIQDYLIGETKFFILLLISILIGLYRNALPAEITINYSNSVIKITFGDLFKCDGLKAIPVSRYLLETQVVSTSLQNKLIQIFLQNQEGGEGFDTYKKALSVALKGKSCEEVYRDATRKNEKYYPLGTTAILEINGQSYILFALTETELKGFIPDDNCNVSKMWFSLERFWREARIQARGNPVNIPLIGSGVTGIRLSPIRLLELNLLAIANSIEEFGKITTEEIRIVLHPKYVESIDLSELRNTWK